MITVSIDVLAFQETWLRPEDTPPSHVTWHRKAISFHVFSDVSQPVGPNCGGGLAIIARDGNKIRLHLPTSSLSPMHFELQMVLLSLVSTTIAVAKQLQKTVVF